MASLGPLVGVLTIDSVGWTKGLDKAKREAQKSAKEIDKSLKEDFGKDMGIEKMRHELQGRGTRGASEKYHAEQRAIRDSYMVDSLRDGQTLQGVNQFDTAGFKGRKQGGLIGGIANRLGIPTEMGAMGSIGGIGAAAYGGMKAGTKLNNMVYDLKHVGHGLDYQRGIKGGSLDKTSDYLDTFGIDLISGSKQYQKSLEIKKKMWENKQTRNDLDRGLKAGADDNLEEARISRLRTLDKTLAESHLKETQAIRSINDQVRDGQVGSEEKDKAIAAKRKQFATEREIAQRDFNESQQAEVKASQDSIRVIATRLQFGDREAKLKEIELGYAEKIRIAEREGRSNVANQLRTEMGVSLDAEKRKQGLSRKWENLDIKTDIGTTAMGLMGNSSGAQKLAINASINKRMDEARESLKGDEQKSMLGNLDTLRKLQLAGVTLGGSVGQVSSKTLSAIGGPTVNGLTNPSLASAMSNMNAAIKVDGWDRQIQLLETIAESISHNGIPARAN